MKRICFSQCLLRTVLCALLIVPILAASQEVGEVYVYFGHELSDIDQVMSRIKDLDDTTNSPLSKLFTHIEDGCLLVNYDTVLDALDYAATVLQSNYNKLDFEQSTQLLVDFECLADKIRKGSFNVDGKSIFYEHILAQQGMHILGKLKVGKSAEFKKNVKIKGVLSVSDAIIESLSTTNLTVASCVDTLCIGTLSVTDLTVISCVDNLCVSNLSVSNQMIASLDIDCDLTVGCNISVSDSTSSAVGNIIKDGVPFIHNFGGSNTCVGVNAGNFTTTGFNNTAVGTNTLSANTSGYNNTVLGSGAMQSNTTGYQNIAIGQSALQNNTIGTDNTAVGNAALAANIIGINNTALGSGALNSNDVGAYNTAVGHAALMSNTTGFQNVAVGQQALVFNTTGFFNTAIGQGAMLFNTTGYSNCAFGTGALVDNTTGVQNTALGSDALSTNTIGNNNTAVGQAALNAIVSGSNNIAVGIDAGTALTSSESDDIYIGHTGVVGESGVIRIGTAAIQTTAFVAGIYNTTTGSATTSPVIVDINGQLGTTPSSRKFKHNIADMDNASALLYKLHPVTFVYNNDMSEVQQYGLIAEEVDAVFPALVTYDKNGEPYTVRYEVLPVLLLNELFNHKLLITQLEQQAQTFAQRLNVLEAQ